MIVEQHTRSGEVLRTEMISSVPVDRLCEIIRGARLNADTKLFLEVDGFRYEIKGE